MHEELHRACGHPLSAHNSDGRCMVDRCRCETDALAWRYLAAEKVVTIEKVTLRDLTGLPQPGLPGQEPLQRTEPVPDRITAIQAWRAWEFRCGQHYDARFCSDGRLYSVTRSSVWPPNAALEATCDKVRARPIADQRAEYERILRMVDGQRSEYVDVRRKVYLNPELNPPGLIPGALNVRYETREHLITIVEPPAHDVPDEGCTCGVYAHKDRRFILDHYDRTVIGVVALWGKVIDAENGYRARYAKPVMLAVADPAMREQVATLYSDCMVIDRAKVRDAAEILGTPVDAANPVIARKIDWSGAFRKTLRAFLTGEPEK